MRLLEGLEASEIWLSDLENEFTIGSEYYAPSFLSTVERIRQSDLQKRALSKCCELITDGDHGSADYREDGVLFILSEAVNEGWINKDACRYISKRHSETLTRSELHPGDVLLTKTGVYFGKSAVVPDSILKANTIAHVVKLVPVASVNPFYLSTFFNCAYGYSQLRRRGIKATRPEIKLIEFQDILVALPSSEFQQQIEAQVRLGLKVQEEVASLYARAESRLLGALKLSDWQPPLPLTYTSTCSTAFVAGGLDAEHFQPRYDALLTHLRDHAPRLGTVRDFAAFCDRGEQPKYFEDGSLAVVNSRHILESGLDYDNFERTDAALWNHPAFSSAHIQRGDILTYTTGAKIGRTAVYLSDARALASNHVNILRLREENSVYVAVVLNSLIGRMQTRRDCTGSAQVELYPSDIAGFSVPFVDEAAQAAIVSDVESSHASRRRAKYLLSAARGAVEAAIEEGEDAGLAILRAAQGEAE